MIGLPGKSWPLWGTGVAALGLVILAILRALRLRREAEFERQVLERLALATRRGQPLAPTLLRAADEAPRLEARWLRAIVASLDAGLGLGAALRHRRGRPFRVEVSAAIDAADGTAQLPDVLDALASRHDDAAAMRFRVGLALAYPLLLASVWTGLCTVRPRLPTLYDGHRIEIAGAVMGSGEVSPIIRMLVIVLSLVWLHIMFGRADEPLGRWLRRSVRSLPWLRSRWREHSTARVLESVAVGLRAGVPTPQALRAAARVARCSDRRQAAELERAADLAERGADLTATLQEARMPESVIRGSMALARGRGLPEAFEDYARQLRARCRRKIDVATQRVQLAALLGFGVHVTIAFAATFEWIGRARTYAMEQMPW